MTTTEEPKEATQPIDVKAAVRAALQYVKDLYSDDQIYDVSLEEVARDNFNRWDITVGFTRRVAVPTGQKQNPTGIGGLVELIERSRPTTAEREYKVVSIDAETGKPISMKIRTL